MRRAFQTSPSQDKEIFGACEFRHPKSNWECRVSVYQTEDKEELLFNVDYWEPGMIVYHGYQILYRRNWSYLDLTSWIWGVNPSKTKAYRRVLWLCKFLTPTYLYLRDNRGELSWTY